MKWYEIRVVYLSLLDCIHREEGVGMKKRGGRTEKEEGKERREEKRRENWDDKGRRSKELKTQTDKWGDEIERRQTYHQCQVRFQL